MDKIEKLLELKKNSRYRSDRTKGEILGEILSQYFDIIGLRLFKPHKIVTGIYRDYPLTKGETTFAIKELKKTDRLVKNNELYGKNVWVVNGK